MASLSTSSLSAGSLVPKQADTHLASSPLFTIKRTPAAANTTTKRSLKISAVHAAEPLKAPEKSHSTEPKLGKWTLDGWKGKKALQLPEYPSQEEVESVLKTLEAFPPLVFAGEARHLEEKLAEAAMGRAFLLQGGDCAESFKEFNANNIRDTFRILLQMGAVLMFGGQVPVVKTTVFRCLYLE